MSHFERLGDKLRMSYAQHAVPVNDVMYNDADLLV